MLHMTLRVVRIVIGTLEDIYGRRKICNGRMKELVVVDTESITHEYT